MVLVITGHVTATPMKILHKPHQRDILDYNFNWIFNTNMHPECFIVNTKTCFSGVWLQKYEAQTSLWFANNLNESMHPIKLKF